MPFQFTCPYCFNKTWVDDKYAGQAGDCACCGKSIILPKNRSDAAGGYASTWDSASTKPNSSPAFDSTAYDNKSAIRQRFWTLAAVVAGLTVVVLIAWQSISLIASSDLIKKFQYRHNRTMSMNNASQIARALQNYAATYGMYPPAVVYDADGKAMHSWRVLILRELGEGILYNRYRFDEPWDSIHNSQLFSDCPRVYISPTVASTGFTSESNYFALTGPNTIFSGQPVAPADVTDGLDQTLMVVESSNALHEWSKPVDVAASGNGPITIGGCYTDGTVAAKANGMSVWIPSNAPPDVTQAFMTIRGGEQVDPDSFKP